MTRHRLAYWLALVVPAALLAGALVFEHVWNMPPCEMCWWQRYPHIAALGFAALGWVTRKDALVALAGLAIMVSGLIGAFHAGVEYKWWEGPAQCSGTALGSDPLAAILNAQIVPCDTAPWTLAGISLAGFNFLISLAAGLAILWLIRGRRAGAGR